MQNKEIRDKEIEILNWLDTYEARDILAKELSTYNVEKNQGKTIRLEFSLKQKKWKFHLNKNWKDNVIKNINGIMIEPLCGEYSIPQNEKHRNDDPEFEDSINKLIETTKNFVKMFYK